MSKYANKQFWIDTLDRAVSTFAQGTLAAILAAEVISVADLNLAEAAGVGALAAGLSVLQSVAARNGDHAAPQVLPGPDTPGRDR